MQDKIIYVNFKSKVSISRNSVVNNFFKSIFSKIRNLFKINHYYPDSKVIYLKQDRII